MNLVKNWVNAAHHLCYFLTFLWLQTAHAQTSEPLVIDRVSSPIKIDGIINEEAWEKILPLPLVTYSPTFGQPGSERTEIRVGYDDRYIYFSGKMYTSDTRDIQGNSLIRDLDLEGDFFNVLLDSYNDNENMLGFFTTPTGNRLDAEVINDAEGPDFWNQSWNAFWDNGVTRTDEGWFAEMRIPFSSLRFEDDDGQVIMGLIVQRRMGQINERLIFPAIPPNWNFARNKPSKAQKILLRGVYSKRAAYLSPFLVSGMDRNGPFEGQVARTSFNTQTGLDVKYSLSNNLTLDATINTDFAQVEADIAQVNLTRFSLFFPERRQFFQERSGIFAFNTGDNTRLFYSRRIGLTGGGDPIKILGGLRLTGRIKNMDLGVLTMQTANASTSPSENFGVIRFRNRVFNQYSFAGGMFTSRLDADGNQNVNYGLDGIFRLFDSDYLSLKWVHTVVDSTLSSNKSSFIDNGLIYANWERRSLDGIGYQTEISRIGQTYNPAMGFIFRNNITSLNQTIRYGINMPDHPLILRNTPYTTGRFVWQNDQSILEYSLTTGWRIDFLTRAAFSIEHSHQFIRLLNDFNFLDRINIPVGKYNYDRFNLSYATSLGLKLRSTMGFEIGSFFNGFSRTLSVNPFWNISKHLSAGVRLEFNRVNFNETDEKIEASIVGLNLTTAFNTHLSINSFVQFNSLEERLGTNVRFRYNFREGHDLFLVYNNQTNFMGQAENLESQVQDSQSVTLKYIYTLLK